MESTRKLTISGFLLIVLLPGCRDQSNTHTETESDAIEVEMTKDHKDQGADDYGPAISPDGSQIAFYSTRGSSSLGRIFLMNEDGSQLKEIAYDNTGGHDVEPHWSPDGKKIAFTSQGNFNDDGGVSSSIYVMNSDGTDLTLLYDHDGDEDGATHFGDWNDSGDGFVFFYWKYGGFEPNIYYINTDGTGLKKLTSDNASFQPDFASNKIWYSSTADGITDWYTLRLNGTERHKLEDLIGKKFDIGTVSTSAFYYCILDEEGGTSTFYKMNHGNNTIEEVKKMKGLVSYFFDVSAEKEYISFNMSGPHNMDIYRLDLVTGEVTALVDDH